MTVVQNRHPLSPMRTWPLIVDRDRAMTAAVLRYAHAAGWRSGHRLGWVRSDATIAVSWRPGVLEVWWRSIAGRWPTTPVSYPVARVDEAVHILIGLKLLEEDILGPGPGGHASQLRPGASVHRAAHLPSSMDDAAVTEKLWRAAAHQPRGLAVSESLS